MNIVILFFAIAFAIDLILNSLKDDIVDVLGDAGAGWFVLTILWIEVLAYLHISRSDKEEKKKRLRRWIADRS